METIDILKDSTMQYSWDVIVGEQTTNLIKRQDKLPDFEKEILINESVELLSQCCDPQGGKCNNTGLAIGYVQSGKTLSFTTVTALAKDNEFKIVIILAGIGNNLLTQTTSRINKDLKADNENSHLYKIYENPNRDNGVHKAISRTLRMVDKPLIIFTVLKHYKRINDLKNVLLTEGVHKNLGNGAVLIIDDEADQASLNNLARKNSKSDDWEDKEYSTTYNSLLSLRDVISNHTYLQYTATPQGPLLISLMDLLSPDFHIILTPGSKYKGGKYFFIDNPSLIKKIPKEQVYHHKYNNLSTPPESLVEALTYFFIGAAIQVRIKKTVKLVSMMVHADNPNDANIKFELWIENIVDNWSEIFELEEFDPLRQQLIKEFEQTYKNSKEIIGVHVESNDLIFHIKQILLDTNIELVIKDKNDIQWSKSSSHILIGANKLNRGFTVEGLMVTYMPRHSRGKSNADTIQQRCRFFGYKDKYIKTCKVYLPNESIDEYISYVEHEEALREGLRKVSLMDYKRIMILDESMNPTRSNILSEKIVRSKLKGWRQFNSIFKTKSNEVLFENLFNDKRSICKSSAERFNYLSKTPDRSHLYCEISFNEALVIISDYEVSSISDVMRKQATIQYLSYLKTENPKKCYIVFMAPYVKIGRKRSLIETNGSEIVNNIWSGRSSANEKEYPGDKAIHFPNSITIQVHLINVKNNNHPLEGKKFYTLGIHYPEEMAINFISTNN